MGGGGQIKFMLKGYLGSEAVDLRRDFPMTQKTTVIISKLL